MGIRSLSDLWHDKRATKQQFARVYAGDFVPPTSPHAADWDQAEDHWVEFNRMVLSCAELNKIPLILRLRVCEDLCQEILWPLALEPHHLCPECKQGANLGALRRRIPPDLLTRAERILGGGAPAGSPDVGDVVAACLADGYPRVSREAITRAAAGLHDHAKVAVRHGHSSGLRAQAVAEFVAADLATAKKVTPVVSGPAPGLAYPSPGRIVLGGNAPIVVPKPAVEPPPAPKPVVEF